MTLRKKMATLCGYDPDTRSFAPDAIIIGGSLNEICAGWADLSDQHDYPAMTKLSAAVISELNPMPLSDLSELVTFLKKMGLRLGLVINDLETAARKQLALQRVDSEFDYIIGCDSGYSPKPDPDALLGFAKSTDIEPSRIAMVGDSLHDLQAARSAHYGLAIGVLTGPASQSDLAPFADHILVSIADLPALLASQFTATEIGHETHRAAKMKNRNLPVAI